MVVLLTQLQCRKSLPDVSRGLGYAKYVHVGAGVFVLDEEDEGGGSGGAISGTIVLHMDWQQRDFPAEIDARIDEEVRCWAREVTGALQASRRLLGLCEGVLQLLPVGPNQRVPI